MPRISHQINKINWSLRGENLTFRICQNPNRQYNKSITENEYTELLKTIQSENELLGKEIQIWIIYFQIHLQHNQSKENIHSDISLADL